MRGSVGVRPRDADATLQRVGDDVPRPGHVRLAVTHEEEGRAQRIHVEHRVSDDPGPQHARLILCRMQGDLPNRVGRDLRHVDELTLLHLRFGVEEQLAFARRRFARLHRQYPSRSRDVFLIPHPEEDLHVSQTISELVVDDDVVAAVNTLVLEVAVAVLVDVEVQHLFPVDPDTAATRALQPFDHRLERRDELEATPSIRHDDFTIGEINRIRTVQVHTRLHIATRPENLSEPRQRVGQTSVRQDPSLVPSDTSRQELRDLMLVAGLGSFPTPEPELALACVHVRFSRNESLDRAWVEVGVDEVLVLPPHPVQDDPSTSELVERVEKDLTTRDIFAVTLLEPVKTLTDLDRVTLKTKRVESLQRIASDPLKVDPEGLEDLASRGLEARSEPALSTNNSTSRRCCRHVAITPAERSHVLED